jgi:predicted AAA+ superfamily ATPase
MGITEEQNKTIELLNPWYLGKSFNLGIRRSLYLDQISAITSRQKEILFLLGSRRVGKTVILFQYIYQLIEKGVLPERILFLSLDNTNLEGLDLFMLLSDAKYDYIFLDEVHYFPNWAQILKSLYDLPSYKSTIVCSGSSSRLIEDNKAFLTGRATAINVFPLSFIEFKEFNKSDNELKDYLYYGGYPEYVLEKQPNYLNDLLRDIVEKDILKLHTVQNSKYLFDICQILAKQVGFKGSSNKIAKVLQIDNKTVNTYFNYLREVRLIEEIYQYSESINEQLYAPKKYYFNDLGMRNSFVGFSDIGSLVENAVFIKLSSYFGVENITYFADGKSNEIDFIVEIEKNKILIIESKYNNLKSSIVNSLNPQIYKEVFNKEVINRIVITDDIKGHEVYNNTVEFIPLREFLEMQNLLVGMN